MDLYAHIYGPSGESNMNEENAHYFQGAFKVTSTITLSTQVHGGFANCSFEIPGAQDISDMRYKTFIGGEVVIMDIYGRRVWEGWIVTMSYNATGVTVDAAGWYTKADKRFSDQIYTLSGTTVYDVVKDATTRVPAWRQTFIHMYNADFIVGAQDYTDKKIREEIESVLKFGYSETDDRPVYFAIWEHRMPYLFPEPSAAEQKYQDWTVSLTNVNGKEGLSQSLDNVFNKVYAVYDDVSDSGPSKTTAAEDTISQTRYGLSEGLVQNGGSPEGLATAQDLRDMALAQYKYPRQMFTLDLSGIVHNGYGAYDYPYMIRAGHILLINDMDTQAMQWGVSSGSVGATIGGFVVNTDYDGASNTVTLAFGITDIKFDTQMSRLGLSGGLK